MALLAVGLSRYLGLAPFLETYETAEHWRLLQDWGVAVSEEGFAVSSHENRIFYRSAWAHCIRARAVVACLIFCASNFTLAAAIDGGDGGGRWLCHSTSSHFGYSLWSLLGLLSALRPGMDLEARWYLLYIVAGVADATYRFVCVACR